MSILIKGMEMPADSSRTITIHSDGSVYVYGAYPTELHRAVPVPTPHGDLIDRDALIKDGWLNLHKTVMRMGGYAVHDLPLMNPSIPVIIEAEEGEGE